jgi:hypothetical protein
MRSAAQNRIWMSERDQRKEEKKEKEAEAKETLEVDR